MATNAARERHTSQGTPAAWVDTSDPSSAGTGGQALPDADAEGRSCLSILCSKQARNAKWLLFWMCWAAAVQGMVVNGFVNVSITSIEKRFDLKSRSTGLIASSYDIACVIVSVPVSFLGSRPGASKPRWLGVGLIVMSIGSLVFALPHFLVPNYDINSGSSGKGSSIGNTSTTALCNSDNTYDAQCESTGESASLSNFQYLFILAQVLQGLGAVPIYTIGAAFIDESVTPRQSAFYLGIFYAMAVVGPAIGYGLGGQFLQFYIDAPLVDPVDLGLTPSSDRWLGGWWMGFFVSGVGAMLVAIPILMTPKVIVPVDSSSNSDQEILTKNSTAGGTAVSGGGANDAAIDKEEDVDNVRASSAFQHLEALPLAIRDLLKNVPYVALSIAESADGFIIAGLAAFLPKLIERQFGLSASLSAVLVGAVAIPAGGGGTFLGGWYIKKFKVKTEDVIKLCFIVSAVTLVSCFSLFTYCPNTEFAGVNELYRSTGQLSSLPNLADNCNANCRCNGVAYNPVCGANNIIYYSPCHAGCVQTFRDNGQEIYGGCSCTDPALNPTWSNVSMPTVAGALLPGQAAPNTCLSPCGLLVPFLMIVFFIMFLTFLISMPNINATLRSVNPEHRALSLGLQGISFRLIGAIPAPILFGVVFDNVCILWDESCGAQGACVSYSNYYMSRYVMALGFSAKTVTTISFFVAWRTYLARHCKVESAAPAVNGVSPATSGASHSTTAAALQNGAHPVGNHMHGRDNLALDPT